MNDRPPLVQVHLLGVPLLVRERALEHDQDLLRELALMRVAAQAPGPSSAPERLLTLADELRAIYGPLSAGPTAEMEAALEQGREFMDVTFTVPDVMRALLDRIAVALEEVEQFAREGRYLLTTGAPDDVAAYRAWVFAEFDRQIAGHEPVPWPGAPTRAVGHAGSGSAGTLPADGGGTT